MGLMSDIGRGISAGAYALSDFAGKAGLEQMRIEAEIERDKRLDEMKAAREKAAIESKRATDQADAATVSAAAKDTATKRDVGNIEKARGLISVDPAEREPISAADVADIRSRFSPEDVKKQYGLDEPSRVQTLRDQTDAAQGFPDIQKGLQAQLNQERLFERADAQDALGNKREDRTADFQNRQLDAQIAHYKAIEARTGSDSSTKELARMKIDLLTKENNWREGLAKLPANDPKRAAEIQKGVDMGWLKQEPNDVSTTVKTTTGGLENPVETSVTTKGRVGAVQPKSIDTLFPKKDAPKPAAAKSETPKPAAPKTGLIAADEPVRDFYSQPERQKRNRGPVASPSDIASAKQAVDSLQARYDAAPVGDGKNLSGPTNAARMQLVSALKNAKDKLQELLNQGK